MQTRRAFLCRTAAAGVAALSGVSRVLAARYDLVIVGGRVIDPASRLDRVMDVAIQGGRIAAVQPGIAVSDADAILDATGRLVVPGLIDIHTHTRVKAMPSARRGRTASRRSLRSQRARRIESGSCSTWRARASRAPKASSWTSVGLT